MAATRFPVHRVYHIVLTDPPTAFDFTSNKAKGLRPRKEERDDPELHDDVSTWASREMAEVWARSFPKIGSYIAELEIPDDAPIRMRRTGEEEGHYSLWGTPEQLLALVKRVYPVRAEPGGPRERLEQRG